MKKFARRLSGLLASIGLSFAWGGASFAQAFEPGQIFPISSAVNAGPESIETADLDQDGNLDLVTADNGFVTVRFGDGAGDFPRRLAIATRVGNATDQAGGEENEYAALADINGDSLIDILVANAPNSSGSAGNSIQIYLNNAVSPGTFVVPPTLVTNDIGTNPSMVRVGQIDPLNDNLLDLAVSLFLDPRLLIYKRGAGLSFTPIFESALLAQSAGESLDIGDFNEDGRPDIAIADRLRAWVFFGDGVGGFPSAVEVTTGPAGAHLEYDVLMRDMDLDGHLDLVVANGGPFNLSSTTHSVVVVYGDGSSTTPTQSAPIDIGGEAAKLAVNDFDGDGVPDIAVAAPEYLSNGRVVVLRNTNTGNRRAYDTVAPVILDAGGRGTLAIVSEDFDRDGRPDIAVGNEGFLSQAQPGNIAVFLNSLPDQDTPTPTRTVSAIPTLTPSPTLTATGTRTATPTVTRTPTITPTRGPTRNPDVNEDGVIDARDLEIILQQQGNPAAP
ncbi:MAG: hypothetical protein GHCLOJNM_01507 [bacterium]|nr:hypothetical protein [bacterium]